MTKVILVGSGCEKMMLHNTLRERGITIVHAPEPTPFVAPPDIQPVKLKYCSLQYPDGKTRRRERRKQKRKTKKNNHYGIK